MMKALRWVTIVLVLFAFPATLLAQDPQDEDPKDYYDEQEAEELLGQCVDWEELASSLLDEGGASLLEFVSKNLEAALSASSSSSQPYMPGDDVTGMTDDIEGNDGSDIIEDAEAPKAKALAKADEAVGAQGPTTPDINPEDYGNTDDNYGKDAADSAQGAADEANANAGKNAKDTTDALTADAIANAEAFDPSKLEVPGETPDIEPDKPGNANTGKGKSSGTPKNDNITISGIKFGPISTGRGDDNITVTNQGTVISLAFDPQPQTVGIDGEEDDDTISNNGTVAVTAISLGNVLKNSPANGSDKENASKNELEEKKGALAVGIVGGEGDDTVENTGAITTTAVSSALDFAIGATGLKVDVGASDAITDAIGVYDDSGDNTITNSGDITATATSTALKAELTANVGISASDDAATAIATSIGMQTGDGDDDLTNEGNITAVSTAFVGAEGLSGSGGLNGVFPRFSPASAHTAEAYSTGFNAGDGDNTLNNTGNITAVSTAVSDVITLDIRANGAAKAISTSNAKTEATALITGDGNDTITNDGALTAVATSVAHAQSAAVSKSGKAPLSKSSWGGEAYAESLATGLQTGAGVDNLTNNGNLTAVATSVAATESAAVSAKGPATVDSTSRSKATTTAINSGRDDDTITNTGEISAVSTATAHTIEFAFSDEGSASSSKNWFEKAIHQGGPQSEAVAVGITADGVEGTTVKEADLKIIPHEIAASASYAKLGASGNDTITNENTIAAVATAVSTAGAGAISLKGAASSDAISKATSSAKGVDAGAGNDVISNSGDITAVSTATAASVAFSYAGSKKGDVNVNASSDAEAMGLSADGIPSSTILGTELVINEDSITSTSSYEKIAATGNDIIDNSGALTAVATATSISSSGSASVKEANSVTAKSTATASAFGIDAGGGDDTITNTGATTAVSTATAGALEISYSKDKDASVTKNMILQALFKGGAAANADAIGIRADGTEASTMTEASLGIDTDSIDETFHHETMASSGDDIITNDGAVTAVATATSGATSVAISVEGAASSDATSKATARAEGIKGGGGDDTIKNTGEVTAVSTATALALEAVFAKGNADSTRNIVTKQIVEYGAKSESEAVGIKGDGENNSYIFDEALAIKEDSINTSLRFANAASSGVDNITNDGNITAVSTAVSGAASLAVSIEDAAFADAKSQATSTAMGVNLGGGDDTLTNNGNITAVSTATALGAGISYAGGKPEDKPDAKPLAAKGGSANVTTSAIATATGISADGMQSGSVTEASLDTQFSIDITEEGVDGTLDSLDARFRHESTAGTGKDTITNNGAVTAVATAVSGSAGIGVSIKGANEAAAKSTATASALGIDVGTGDDIVTNTGDVTAVSTAVAAALEVSFSKDKNADTTKNWLKQAFANNGVVAESEAIGIRGDGTESSSLTEANLHIGYDGIQERFYHETMASSGADTIINDGAVTAVSTAVAGEASVAVSIEGASQADATSTALSRAEGIKGGGGDDTITNTGAVTAVSTATALALEASFSKAKDADSTRGIITKQFVEYGAKAESEAYGIKGDGEDASHIVVQNLLIGTEQIHADAGYEYAASSGVDEITNSGAVTAVSTAVSGAASIGISINGAGRADAKSQAKSTATAVDAGAGDDTITNSGDMTAVSTATAVGVGISYAGGKANDTPGTKPLAAKGGSVNVGTSAEAEATGISGDGLLAGNKIAGAVDLSFEALDVGFSNDYSAATGNDTITNNGAVTAVATAASGSAGIGISIKGANEAAAKSTAKAIATGIDAGTGDDTITNTGNVTAVSTAVAAALEFSFSKDKDASTTKNWLKQAFSNNGVVAEAESIGIRGDGTEASHFTDAALHVDYDQISENFHHESVASTGNDTITNSGAVTSVATAVSGEVSAAVSIDGAAKSDATSKATSLAEGIRAGAGDDTVTNTGDVVAVSTATALSLEGTFSKGKNADSTRKWLTKQIVDYGATAQSEAVGIKGDGDKASHTIDQSLLIEADSVQVGAGYEYAMSSGNDTINNEGEVVAVSTAVSGGGSGALSLEGAASADAKSRAKSIATGVDAGDGDDTVTNSGNITAVSTATALALGVAIDNSRGSVAYADAGAVAESTGITGDGNLSGGSADASLYVDTDGLSIAGALNITNASGDDTINNDGAVTAVSTAVSGAGSVAVSLSGAASANMSSSAKALAIAIDAGAGSDEITNNGDLTAVSTAVAGAFSAGVSGKGNSAWNDFKSLFVGGTNAQATATGITGDGSGKDFSSTSTLDVDFNELDVKLTNETSYVMAGADDTITNNGLVTATAVSVSPVIDAAIAIDGKATAVSTAKASSDATGIDGGTGNDTINNTGDVVATAVSTAGAVVVSVSKSGAFVADTIWDGGTEATAEAVGIKGDGEGSEFHSSGLIDITDEAVILSADLSSTAVTGDDTINNDGAVVATAVSVVPSLGVAISVEGTGVAASTSTSNAKAVGIDAGAGNDSVINAGDITATAVSTAVAMNVAVSKGLALSGNSLWNGGTTATSEAIGIRGDGEGQDFSASGDIVVADGDVWLEAALSSTAATGEDTINNSGAVVATSVATAPALDIAVSIDSVSAAVSTSTADARAVGIDAGAGNDTITNTGEVVATSVATAASANISVSKSAALAGSSLWDGATKATSEAIGITGDGEGKDLEMSGFIGVVDGDVMIGASLNSDIAGGDDTINNDGAVVATSVATVPSLGVAVSIDGVSGAVSKAEVNSRALGIDAGVGNDTINNTGEVVATSVATAVDLNVAVSKSVALAGNGLWDGATTAISEAIGISGDGDGNNLSMEGSIAVVDGNVQLSAELASTAASGNDNIDNTGKVVATSVATAPSAAVAVAVSGGSAALSTATADSLAVGIDAGAGSDTVFNSGEIVSTSTAIAATGNVSVAQGLAVSTGGLWDGGATATSEAIGISGDGKGSDLYVSGDILVVEGDVYLDTEFSSTVAGAQDDITNEGAIVASSVAIAPTLDVAVAIQGFAMASSKSTAEALSVGIDAGTDDDTVLNSGEIVSTAVANADAISVAVTPSGVTAAGAAIWDGGITATSEAIGISGDGKGSDTNATGSIEVVDNNVSIITDLAVTTVSGNDTITNDGAIVATSVAATPSLAVSIAATGVATALATSTSDATAVGIDGGSGDDSITNTGDIVSTAVASANALSISGTGGGLTIAGDSIWDGGTTAISEAVGISGDGKGTDLHASGSIVVADGDVLVEGETSSTTVKGNDEISNDGTVTVTSVSEALSGAVSVAVEGVALGVSTSTSKSSAVGIDGGAGDDVITNNGAVVSTSVANANAIAVSFTTAGVSGAAGATLDGGTKASSEAIGISGDGKGSDFHMAGSTEVSDNLVKINSELSSTMVTGDDTINNTDTVVATSVAVTPSVGVALTGAGLTVAAATSTAESRSAAIDAGAGNDAITNSGELVSTSVASANSVSVAVSLVGVAGATDGFWNGGTTAKSEAIGISGDGNGKQDLNMKAGLEVTNELISMGTHLSSMTNSGDDVIDNSGKITATSVAEALSLNVAFTTIGVAAAISTATAESRSAAIDSGSGNDEISNSGELVSTSVAVAIPVSAAVLVGPEGGGGVGISSSGATAISEAVGISGDGKGSNLLIDEQFNIIKNSEEDISVTNDFMVESTMVSGDDTINNSGDITATSVAEVPSLSVSFSLIGATAAVSSSSAESRAVAIDGGSGDDNITNSGELVATAVANANTVNISVAPAGGAIAGDTIWDGGTKAVAEAIGISGDGKGKDYEFDSSIEVEGGDVRIAAVFDSRAVSGNDFIDNDNDITATSVAVAPSIGVAVAVGVAGAASTATAESRAAAIDAGGGNDIIDNSGELEAVSVANADAVSISVSGGGSVSGDAFWNGGTTAKSQAVGISGDGNGLNDSVGGVIAVVDDKLQMGTYISSEAASGNDMITNTGKITATSVSVAPSVNIAASAGIAASIASATAESEAMAIDAGAGDDTIYNNSELEATSVANADAIAATVLVSPFGAAVSVNGIFDGGVTATSHAAGISGDGIGHDQNTTATVTVESVDDVRLNTLISTEAASGNDTITNDGKISATSVAVAPAVTVSLTLNGVAAAVSTATAEATAVAIDAGSGDDTVTNTGDLLVESVANADAVNITTGLFTVAVAADAVWSGGTTAIAKSVGISGDNMSPDETILSTIEAVDGEISFNTTISNEYAGGNDTITNDGNVTTTSVVVAPSVSVAVAGVGIAAAMSTATAESTAISIDAGAGDDVITNNGVLESTSVANADAISVSVTGIGASVSADAVWDGGTKARADAVGISGDGIGSNENTEAIIEYADDAVLIALVSETEAVSGNDTITNTNTITTTSVAVTPSISVAANAIGISAAMSTSTAEANSTAIDAGDGDDTVNNSGNLTAESVSVSTAVSVSASLIGVSGAGTAAWDGGTTAKAEAVGIKGDSHAKESTTRTISIDGGEIVLAEETLRESTGGNDTIINSGDIEATATSVTVAADVALTGIGVAAAVSTSTADASATAIDAGAGDDNVTNTGNLIADAEAVAVSVGVGIAPIGLGGASGAVWDGGTTAKSEAVGISGDGRGEKETTVRGILVVDGDVTIEDEVTESEPVGGNDTINNDGSIHVSSTAVAPEVNVAATVLGVSAALSTSTAESDAAAIDAGAGNDIVNNTGMLTVDSSATSVAVAVGVTGIGAAGGLDTVWEGGTTARSAAHGIDGGEGADQITNEAAIVASSKAEAVSVDVAVDVIGVAAALSAATADAGATSIDGSDGNDTITNNATLSSIADADATGVSVAVSLVGYAATDTSTNARSEASGIDGGSGNDVILNTGYLYSESTASATAAEIDVTLAGAASSDTPLDGETKAQSFAAGLVGGDGSDELTNADVIDLKSEAATTADSVSVAIVGYSKADIATTVSADAVGMAGGGGVDYLTNNGLIYGRTKAEGLARVVPATLVGASIGDLSITSISNATGMAGGDGNDGVTNSGTIDIESKAFAPASIVSVGLVGEAKINASTNADSSVVGMDGGSGGDCIVNAGMVDANSDAGVSSTGVSVELVGNAVVDNSATANSDAIGMNGGEGEDVIINSGTVVSDSIAGVTSTAVGFTLFGASGTDTSLVSSSIASGLEGGDNADYLENSGTVEVNSTSTASGTSVTITGGGAGKVEGSYLSSGKGTGMGGGMGDDTLYNSSSVKVDVTSTTSMTQVSVALGGAALRNSSVTASANAAGLEGSGGNDYVENTGNIEVDAAGKTSQSGASVTLAGQSGTDSSVGSSAEISGVDTGGGSDYLNNEGSIISHSRSELDAEGGSVTILGASDMGGSFGSDSIAYGVDSGDGDDYIESIGSVDTEAVSKITQNGTSFSLTGYTNTGGKVSADSASFGIGLGSGADYLNHGGTLKSKAESTLSLSNGANAAFGYSAVGTTSGAIAESTGINAGDGNDYVEGDAAIDVDAITTVTQSGSTFTFGGGSGDGSAIRAESRGTGIDAGAGVDYVGSDTSIDVDATASLNVSGKSSAGFGVSNTGGTSGAVAQATGIATGDDASVDGVESAGSLDVSAKANVTQDGSSFTFGGKSGSGGALTADSLAQGVITGGGMDFLNNKSGIKSKAESTLDIKGKSDTIFGAASAGGISGAVSESSGMESGGGDDFIDNDARVDVDAIATINQTGSSFTLGGASGGGGKLAAESLGVGLEAGAGGDIILNSGEILVNADSSLDVSSGSTSIFGAAGSGAQSGALAEAYGLSGGAGNDYIESSGQINVNVTSDVKQSGGSFSLAGSSSSGGRLYSAVSGTGITSGSGGDYIKTSMPIYVWGRAEMDITGGSTSVFGASSAGAESGAIADLTGLDGGSGNDQVENLSGIYITSITDMYQKSSAFTFGGGGSGKAVLSSNTAAMGIDGGSGSDKILNDGTLSVYGYGYLENVVDMDVVFGISADGSVGSSTVNSVGISGGYDNDVIDNSGYLSSSSHASAVFNSSAVTSAIGGASVNLSSTESSVAYGVDGGSGADSIGNFGTIYVDAYSLADAYNYSWATVGGALSKLSMTADSDAFGILGGSSNDLLYNENSLNVYSHAVSDLFAKSTAAVGYSKARTYAYAYATSAGIEGGSGNDSIGNAGTISVTAEADANAVSKVYGLAVQDVGAYAEAKSWAYGILDLSGHNTVVNEGIITVTADADANKTERKFRLFDADTKYYDGAMQVESVGIKTGSGGDTIVNEGTISAYTRVNNGSLSLSTAIDSGSGNDTVVLSETSDTNGNIYLRSGNDSLYALGGHSFGYTAYAGEETGDNDKLYLVGVGALNGTPLEFETTIKQGAGTYSIPSLPTMEKLEMEEGTLQIDSYEFSPEGVYLAQVNGDGSCGLLEIGGAASLSGQMEIRSGKGAFIDETSYSILQAATIDGVFDSMKLPDSPILTFKADQNVNDINVKVEVGSFETIADSGVESKIAEYLDKLTLTSSGELNNVIGEFQRLSKSDFDQAFSSVSPEQYLKSAKAYMKTTMKSFDAIQGRLNTLRKSVAYAPLVNGMNNVGTLSGLTGVSQKPVGFWQDGFDITYYEEEPGIVKPLLDTDSFSSLGFDRAIDNNLVVGFGQDYSEVKTSSVFTDGDNATSGQKNFTYVSYMLDDIYMDAAFFYGNESYDHQRDITVGIYEGTATTYHEGKSFSSYVQTGKLLTSGSTIFEPFASLEYIHFEEDGFTESGGGVLALKIEDMERELLISNLGISTSKMWVADGWTIMPEISLSWRYHVEPADYSTTASFVSASSEYFVIDGEHESRHALGLGASLDIINFGKFTSTLDLNRELFTDDDSYDVEWKMVYNF